MADTPNTNLDITKIQTPSVDTVKAKSEDLRANIDNIIKQFFKFIQLDPVEEILLKDHLIYFILLASFKRS